MTPRVIIIHNPTVWNAKDSEGEFLEADRRVSAGKGGDHQRGNGQSVVLCVSDLDGMEDIVARPQTFVTTYEKIKGYRDNGNTIPPEQPDKAQYDSVYTGRTTDELPSISGGYDMSHLVLN